MKVSLHIGVNVLDKSAYRDLDERLFGQAFQPLRGCLRDAKDFEDAAAQRGFETAHLYDEKATAGAVLDALAGYASRLRREDLLFLTYSGHGAQIPRSPDPSETDGRDETWVLRDRQLIDGELYDALAGFAKGVRVFVVSDSCSSGTALRLDRGADVLETPLGDARDRERDSPGDDVLSRWWPWGASNADVKARGALYESVRARLDLDRRIDAAVAYFAACQDDQEALERGGRGCFTRSILDCLGAGSYPSYKALFDAVKADMQNLEQKPNYVPMGSEDLGFHKSAPLT